jgi:pimeloyl-ACP methyl ester carboxylesterase
MKWILIPLLAVLAAVSCSKSSVPENYLDYSGRSDVLSGGVRMIPISTPKGTLRVWTKRIGANPRIKVLLLHGGPAMTHEYLEAFDSYFPKAGIEYYYYDQLGSAYSDQPKDLSCGNCPDSWKRWNRFAPPWVSIAATSICSATPGAEFSAWSTRSNTKNGLSLFGDRRRRPAFL